MFLTGLALIRCLEKIHFTFHTHLHSNVQRLHNYAPQQANTTISKILQNVRISQNSSTGRQCSFSPNTLVSWGLRRLINNAEDFSQFNVPFQEEERLLGYRI
jgi:hypothetical protein